MRVTFDTNNDHPVVESDRYSNHKDLAVFAAINAAIRDGRITPFHARGTITIGPDHNQHPGVSQRETERLERAIALGFRLLAQPRIGRARPDPIRIEHFPERFAADTDIKARQEKFGEVATAHRGSRRRLRTRVSPRTARAATGQAPGQLVRAEGERDPHKLKHLARKAVKG